MIPATVSSPLALRTREAAKAIGLSARTLWGLTAPRGPIPCIRLGHGRRRVVLYPLSELQNWLRQAAQVKGATNDPS
jgi:predicted DNA-binding transcriptional regulator AlpA